tara:strand:- start:983 stop:1321 length:339 start_codon:yes stop_codon:yes gene_type:complete
MTFLFVYWSVVEAGKQISFTSSTNEKNIFTQWRTGSWATTKTVHITHWGMKPPKESPGNTRYPDKTRLPRPGSRSNLWVRQPELISLPIAINVIRGIGKSVNKLLALFWSWR